MYAALSVYRIEEIAAIAKMSLERVRQMVVQIAVTALA